MAGMMGGSVRTEGERLSGVQLQSSAYGLPIPIVHGTTRIPGNLIWYSDFKAIAHTESQGGKGGPSFENTNYTYTTALAFGLCEGEVAAVPRVWVGKEQHDPTTMGFTVFKGAPAQGTWGWMDTAHASQSLNYRRLAYVGASTYNLGNSASIGNHTFEISGPLRFGGPGSVIDVNPRDSVVALLTDPHTGAGWSLSRIGNLDAFSDACVANGIFISLALSEQRPAAEVVQEIVRAANAQIVCSEGLFKVVPYADRTATANGVTYTPSTTPLYDLTDDDCIVGGLEDPIQCVRRSPADAYNQVRVEYLNRANDYNVETVEAKDQADIEIFGLRPMDVLQLHLIHDKAIAQVVADQILRRVLYLRNEYRFRLGWRYAALEPMDLVTITDPGLGLDRAPVRITEIEESEDGVLSITAEEVMTEGHTAAIYATQDATGHTPDFNVAPGNTNAPVIFEPPHHLDGSPNVYIAASGGVNWGGCEVWASFDDASYQRVGVINTPARHGTLTASLATGSAIDITHTLAVDLTAARGELLTASQADVDNLATLCWVDGEIVAYRDAALTSAYHYDLSYLARGLYGSGIAAHASATKFVRLDDTVFKLPYLAEDVGRLLYLKFRSFNVYGSARQDISALTPVTYTITGYAPPAVANLALIQPFVGSGAKFKWDPSLDASWYTLKIYVSGVLKRTVSKIGQPHWEYSFEDARADGGPWRAFDVQVRAESVTGVSAYTTLSVNNPQCAAPSGLTITSSVGGIGVKTNRSTDDDFAGMLVYMSTTTGFTPGSGNLVYEGPDVATFIGNLTPGTTYYLRVGHFDRFGQDSLSLSTEVTGVPTGSAGGISVVATLPGSGTEGQVVYLTTDDKLYRHNGTSWQTWVDGADLLAASVTAGKISVASLSAISANIGSITAGNFTLDSAGWIKTSGVASFSSGTGIWIGYDGTAYKFRVGNPAGNNLSWDGSTLSFTGALSGATGSFSGSLSAATGTFAGSLSAATGTFAGALSAATGSFGAVSATGSITVSTTGAVMGGQTAYNTGTGFFLGYSSGAYKFSIGNPSGNYLTWDGSTLTLQGNLVDKRTFTAGTTLVAAASAEVFMPGAALAYAKTKAITVPRGGTLRCTWDIYAGTTGSNTKSRIYKNGTALSSEFIDTSIGWATHTYDATVAAGDSIEVWTYWNSTQGKCRNFTLGNNFNENFFVVSLDS